MSPVQALGLWAQIGVAMCETDPEGFVAIVERAAEKAGLRPVTRAPNGRPGRAAPDLKVLDGGLTPRNS